MLKDIHVPDIGSYANVEIIEVSVAPGDKVEIDTGLITLETDKATMEIPSPVAGVVKTVHVKAGDKVSKDSLILTVEMEGGVAESEAKSTEPKKESKKESTEQKQGPRETQEKSPPNPPFEKGGVQPLSQEGGSASLSQEGGLASLSQRGSSSPLQSDTSQQKDTPQKDTPQTITDGNPHASPGIRRFARELGVDLLRILQASGPKGRILKEDIQAYIRNALGVGGVGGGAGTTGATSAPTTTGATTGSITGLSIAPPPTIDFAQFGAVESKPLSRIQKLSGAFLHRNWITVPHITQFDEADITDLEKFRKENMHLAEKQGFKLTSLVFIMKAVANALRDFPKFNASLDPTGTSLILKKYFHIGVAVDTPNGLVVPVIREVDQKGLFQLAKELGDISQRARKGALTAVEMQGSCFSISSLGGIGGTAFTPIINVPDVAILGVSKSVIKPVYTQSADNTGNTEGDFKPRLMLPLSLSYDHRVIDGAEGARFIVALSHQLGDIRRLLF